MVTIDASLDELTDATIIITTIISTTDRVAEKFKFIVLKRQQPPGRPHDAPRTEP
jgi:hypothetical protein